jgi:excisionase family DNA binding protein
MTDPGPPPIVADHDIVIIRGDALPLLYRATIALMLRHRRDGLAPPALLHQLRATLYRAVMSLERHELPTAADDQPCCECQGGGGRVSVSEAAQLLQLSRRQVQRRAADHIRGGLVGVRIGRTWLLDRRAVLTLAERRDRDRRQLSSVMGPARDKPSDRAIT